MMWCGAQGDEPLNTVVAWQVIIDEFQHGFEFSKEQQKEPNSNATFAAGLLSAQGRLLKDSSDLLLFMYSGTHMDFSEPHLQTGVCRLFRRFTQSVQASSHNIYACLTEA